MKRFAHTDGKGPSAARRAGGGRTISIRAMLLLVVSVFVLALLTLAFLSMGKALEQMNAAKAMRENNSLSSHFLDSAGAYAAERGLTNAALSAPTAVAPDTLSQIAQLRQRGDAALSAALDAVAGRATFPDKQRLVTTVLDNKKKVDTIRGIVDAQLALEGAARDAAVSKPWVPTVTALIMSSQDLRIAAQVVPSSALARTQIMLDLRQSMWVISEYAGRERAAIGGLIGRNAPMNTATLAELSEHRGRLEQAWAMIEAYEKRDFADPAIVSAISTARAAFFETFETVREDVYEAGTGDGAYPIAGDQWIAAATKAIDTLLALSTAIGNVTSDYTSAIESGGRTNVVVNGIVLVLAVVLGAFSFWIVVSRVSAPVQRLTSIMSRLADGDLEVAIPSVERGDEIGQMARAVEVFRQAGLNNLRLEAEAEESRKLTDQERRQREAQKAAEALELQDTTAALGTALERLAEGDLTVRIETPFVGTLEQVRLDFNGSIEKLHSALRVVGGNAEAIAGGSREIQSASDDLAKRTEQQAAAVEETAAALEEITQTVADSTHRAEEAGGLVAKTRTDAERSGQVVRSAIDAMGQIENSSNEISNIIGVIDDIAFQTNLLALNAGVEAARAGEAGKGFAVVAQEVRELAQRSASAAKEIKTLITTSSEQVKSGVQLVGETGRALEQIVAQVSEIDLNVSAIVEAAREQTTGLKEINNAVNAMDQGTQQNAAMVEQTTAASHSLAREAETLRNLLSQFKTAQHASARIAEAHAQDRPVASPAHRLMAKVAGAHGTSAALARGEWEDY